MLASQQSEIRVLKFAADGERLAVLDAEEIRIWPLEESASAVRPERILPSGGSNRLAVAPQGNWLAAGGIEDGEPTVRLWDLAAPLGAEPLLLNKPDAGVPILGEMTFDPTGQWLVTTNGRRAIFWPLQRRYAWVLRGHSFPVGGLAFTPDGRALVSASADGSVRLWPLSGEGWKSRVILEGAGELWALDIDRSGERIAVGGVQGKVAVLSLDGGPSQELAGYSSKVDIWEVAFSPDGGRVAAAALRGPPEDKVVRVWDLASGEAQVLGSVQGAGEDYQGSVAFLEFLGEDRLLSAGEASALSLWDLRRGTVEVLQEGRFGGMAADERGRFLLASRLLSAEIEGRMARSELVLRSLEGSEVRTLPSHGTHPTLLDLDSAAGVVASGSEDGLVRVGPLSGEEPHVLFAHGGKVLRVAISPDGRWIASGGWDGLIRLWPMPDLSQPPFHTLPHDHLLARLHALTTVRVVEDPDSPTGWTLDTGPFPGWETVPTW
jgi:WD40 repeat protein